MTYNITRRSILAGLLSGVAGAAFADLGQVSRTAPPVRVSVEDMIAQAGLGGAVGCVLLDARTGAVLQDFGGQVALPPASVAKAATALYAIGTLGGAHRFQTRILGTGTLANGVLNGDLVIAGGGDPVLSTDDLAQLAKDLTAAGLREITGRLLCWGGALPYIAQIEPEQLDHLGYNPSVSGLNLNFNRVHCEWTRVGGEWRMVMDARTGTYQPEVTMASVRVVDRAGPVWATDAPDRWSVARSALGNGGARWMPVRQPELYAGDVFRTLCRAEGLRLPEPVVTAEQPSGQVLALHQSDTLRSIVQGLLRFSTNITAEVCGLATSAARRGQASGIEASAAEMNRWIAQTYGITGDFKDHSGLSDRNRISASQMARLLVAVGPDGPLKPLLREVVMRDAQGNPLEGHPAQAVAKTGTLNFVSALSGYLTTPRGRELAFAIFTFDDARRAQAKASGEEVPAGAADWSRRSRALQQRLLQRWALIGPA